MIKGKTILLVIVAPYIMLLIDGASLFLYKYDLWRELYWYIIQSTGHSILVGLVMLIYAWIHRFCLFSKVSILGLISLNLLNITHRVFNLSDYTMYANCLIITGIFLSTILFIKWIRK